MNLYNINKERRGLAIWQQNLNKSPNCQHDLLSSRRLARHNIDIVALQEPSVNFLNKTIATQDWTPLYPSTHEKQPEKTRSITLIRSDLLTESWEQLDFPSGDVTATCVKEDWGTVKKQPSQDVLHGNDVEEELGLARLVSSYTLPHQNSQPGEKGRQTARSKVLSRCARGT